MKSSPQHTGIRPGRPAAPPIGGRPILAQDEWLTELVTPWGTPDAGGVYYPSHPRGNEK